MASKEGLAVCPNGLRTPLLAMGPAQLKLGGSGRNLSPLGSSFGPASFEICYLF